MPVFCILYSDQQLETDLLVINSGNFYLGPILKNCNFYLGQCQVATGSSAAALGLANVGGVFVALVGGLLIACVIALLEYVWSNRQQKFKKTCVPRLYGQHNHRGKYGV